MFKFRRGNLSSWKSTDPILEDGQAGIVRFDDGSYSMKIGDGSTSFSQLQYISALPMIQELSNVNWNELKSIGLYRVLNSATLDGAPNGAETDDSYNLSITQQDNLIGQVVLQNKESPVTHTVNKIGQAREFDGSKWHDWKYLIDEDQPVVLNDWNDVKRIVQTGKASSVFQVGQILYSKHNIFGTIPWIVIDFDKELTTPSMTLWMANTLPRNDLAYDMENHVILVDTAMHKWLNSDSVSWVDSSFASRVPTELSRIPGFLNGFSEDFKLALGDGVKKYYCREHSEYTFNEFDIAVGVKMWSLSTWEIKTIYGVGPGGAAQNYHYFKDIQAVDDDVAKQLLKSTSGYSYWLQTPTNIGNTTGTIRAMTGDGIYLNAMATTTKMSVRPACAII